MEELKPYIIDCFKRLITAVEKDHPKYFVTVRIHDAERALEDLKKINNARE